MPNDKNVILAISKRLGHSSPTTTLSIYAHMMPEQEDMILSMLNNS
jgi:integrase